MASPAPIVQPETAITPDVPVGQTAIAPAPDETAGLGNLVEDVPVLIEETRRGWKTSEFWGAIVAVAADVGLDLGSKDKVLISALAAIYALARGVAKNGVANVTPAPPA
jgi:hypothetical protein